MSVIHVTIYYGHGYWVTTAIFTLFKFVDNITLPAKGEVEGSKNFYTVIIELVPIKKNVHPTKKVSLLSLYF